MRKRKIYLFFFFQLFFITVPSHSAVQPALPPVLIGFDIGSPPFFDVKNGCASGIYPLIVEAALTDAGLSMSSYSAPFNRIIHMMDAGELGAGGILKTPERTRNYDFSEPIFVEEIVVYYNRIKSNRVTKISDLKGKRVGVIRGWSYGKKIDLLESNKNVVFEAVSSDLSNFKKLQLGRIDALFTIKEVGLNLIGHGEFSDIVSSGMVIKQNKSYIAFSKKSHHSDLLRKINFSINKLKNSGEISLLVNKYLKNIEYDKSGELHAQAVAGYSVQLNQRNCPVPAGSFAP